LRNDRLHSEVGKLATISPSSRMPWVRHDPQRRKKKKNISGELNGIRLFTVFREGRKGIKSGHAGNQLLSGLAIGGVFKRMARQAAIGKGRASFKNVKYSKGSFSIHFRGNRRSWRKGGAWKSLQFPVVGSHSLKLVGERSSKNVAA